MEVTKSSNVSVQEIIQLNKLQRYANNDLLVNAASINKSVNPALCLKKWGDEELVLDPTDGIYKKSHLI